MRIGSLEILFHKKGSESIYPFGWKRKVRKIIIQCKKDSIKEMYLNCFTGEFFIFWKVPAIKECRSLYHWGLKEAKDVVEYIERTMPLNKEIEQLILKKSGELLVNQTIEELPADEKV